MNIAQLFVSLVKYIEYGKLVVARCTVYTKARQRFDKDGSARKLLFVTRILNILI